MSDSDCKYESDKIRILTLTNALKERFVCQNKHKGNGGLGQNYRNMNYIHFQCNLSDLTLTLLTPS